MKQILQDLRRGETTVIEAPQPLCGQGQVLISSRLSLISGGTEKSLVEFGQANLISKARSRPDKVQQVLGKLKTDGLLPTMEAVFSPVEKFMPRYWARVALHVACSTALGSRMARNGIDWVRRRKGTPVRQDASVCSRM